MLKILLVYDDFQELTSVESMLRKIGFDVVGITSEFSLAEQLLSFNPQVVLAQGKTAKVSTANVGRRLRESLRWEGKSILIFHAQNKPQPLELLRIRMDVGLEYPVEPTRLVQALAQIGNLDATQLLDKLIKNMAQESAAATAAQNQLANSSSQSVFVSGGVNPEANKSSTAVGGSGDAPQTSAALGGATQKLQARGAYVGGPSGDFSIQNTRTIGTNETPSSSEKNSPTASQSPAESESGKKPLFPLGDPVKGPQSQGVMGGSAEADPALSLKGNAESGRALDLKGSEGSSQNPLDVKGPQSLGEGSSDVKGAGASPNLFQLSNMPQDPLLQELESLLQPQKPAKEQPLMIEDPARQKKYEEFLKTLPIQKMSSIKRREAKLRLKDLIKDIDKTELQDQDGLRREFVNALFKKRG